MSYSFGSRDEAERGAPVGIRIQRRISNNQQLPAAPPTVPAVEVTSSSSSEEEKEVTSPAEIRVATLKQGTREETTQAAHTPLGERTSYVEEPPSTATTLDRRERKREKETALARRITNDMQVSLFAQKVDMAHAQAHGGAFSSGSYRITWLRYFEVGLRKLLWYLGKTVANHKIVFTFLPLLLFAFSLVIPLMSRDRLTVTRPFAHLFSSNDVISNGYGMQRNVGSFNYSNPTFTSMDFMDENTFAVLIKTKSPRDSVLRRDAVLAYSALKNKLDDYPVGHREFLETCPGDCESERDMVDRIIKKSSQVALTYPETFVSMSKESTNLTRVYLGAAIGGVETDTDGAISRAQSLLMTFRLRDDLTVEQRQAWIDNFHDMIDHTSAANVSLTRWCPPTFQKDLVMSLTGTHKWLVCCAIIVMVFCLLASFGINAYQSKPVVGVAIGVSLAVSCLGGLFVQTAGNTVYNALLWPVFFTIIGIGVLWLLQLHLSWGRFSFAAVHPTEKIAFILAHDAPGIVQAATVTVVTYLALGMYPWGDHMSASFMTLAAGLTLLCIFALMFVAVFIYMGGRRESRGVKWYQLFKTGDTHFPVPNLTSFDASALFALHDRLLDTRASLSRTIAAQLVAPRMRYPIVLFCTAYLMCAGWGCASVRVELREEHFLPSSSIGSHFIRQYRDMFGRTTQYMEVIIEQAIDYHDDVTRLAISELLESAVTDGFAARSVSWLAEFEKFEKNSIYDVNQDTFVPVVNLVFLSTDPYRRFSSDVTFDRFQTQIIRSRMYLELTAKGVEQRVELVEKLMTKALSSHLPLAVRAPFTISLQHDLQSFSSMMLVLGASMVLLMVVSLLSFGQPALTLLLLFTSATVVMETVGFSSLWNVPMNVVTCTMILSGNALTCVMVMSFCYSYSVSGKGQMRATTRIQYTYQATLFPVLFACVIPVITYIPLLATDSPIVGHIWKILLVNSAACLLHYLFFLPNLMLLLSEHVGSCSSLSCTEICCDIEDDNSIYYIPTNGRAVHPEGLYHHASYTYSVPKSINVAPPNYLAIGAPPSAHPGYTVEYGRTTTQTRRPRRQRRNSESSLGASESSPNPSRAHRERRKVSKDDSIYEAPPTPRQSSRSTSPRHIRVSRESRTPYFEPPPMGQMAPMGQWRPFQPQPYPAAPPTVPAVEVTSSSSSEEEKEVTSPPEIRVATLKQGTRKETTQAAHTPLGERTSYVEEPPSAATTLDRRERKREKETALVRRITNDMQVSLFAQKVDMAHAQAHGGAFSSGSYRITWLRYFEVGLRKMLWYLGKTVANHKIVFTFLPLLLFAFSLVIPSMSRDRLTVTRPFAHLFSSNDVISNGYGMQRNVGSFNYSNPTFTAMDFMDENTFAVLIKTKSPRDSVLRRDAVLAYSALKKKLDDYPVGHREFLETCPGDCESERDMVDRIIKKSSQVALTYPETFVSMSKESTNLTRVYLGAAIGGVETDTDGAISRAQSLLMTFRLRDDLTAEQRQAWIDNFHDMIDHTSATNVSLTRWCPPTFQKDLVTSLTETHKWLVCCAIIVMAFCLLASFGINAYQSKPVVGVVIGVSLAVSCLGGLFVQTAGNTVYNALLWPVFFTIIGIALLWLLQLHLSWGRFSFAAVHPTEKIAFILAHDAPGIVQAATVTVVTYLALGMYPWGDHMSASFMTLAAGLTLLCIFALMFVAVFIYMGGRRESRGVKWYQLFKTGDTHFPVPNLTSFDASALFALHDRLLDTRASLSRTIAAQLVAPRMRYPIVLFCTAYLMCAGWGCTSVRVELREEHFLPSSSIGSHFIRQYRDMFGRTTQYMEVIIEQAIDYHDDVTRLAISELLESAVTDGFAARSVSWLAEFEKFEKNSIYDVNQDTFVPVVNLVFLSTDPYRRFSSDVTFDRFQTQIIRSRMYLELTAKGVEQRVELVEKLMTRALSSHLPLAVRAPFTISLQHDLQSFSSMMLVLGASMVLLMVVSLLSFGQAALTLLLLFSSATVVMETVGFSSLWNVPMNVVTCTMILSGNALTCVMVMSFCYSYSVSGKGQMRATTRIQYTYQATLFPVLFACVIPVITYIPLLATDSPIVGHIWKILLVNSAACLLHYLFFLPNLMLLLSEHVGSCSSLSCTEICCDIEDDNSIYYIPTNGRAVHPEGLYHHASYTYSVPKSINVAPPNYLAIGAPPSAHPGYTVEYGRTTTQTRRPRRQRRNSESSLGASESSPNPSRTHRERRKVSKDDSIYEAPPSPRQSSRSTSPRHIRVSRESRTPYFEPPPMGQMAPMGQWRPFQPQPYVFYPGVYQPRR